MRRTKLSGSFFICLLINMLLNFEGIIPAAVLLALHLVLKLSVWWAAAALIIWLLWLIVWMKIIGSAGQCGNTADPPKENKNPYSSNRQPKKTINLRHYSEESKYNILLKRGYYYGTY